MRDLDYFKLALRNRFSNILGHCQRWLNVYYACIGRGGDLHFFSPFHSSVVSSCGIMNKTVYLRDHSGIHTKNGGFYNYRRMMRLDVKIFSASVNVSLSSSRLRTSIRRIMRREALYALMRLQRRTKAFTACGRIMRLNV